MVCFTAEEFRKTLSLSDYRVSLDEKLYPFFDTEEADCFSLNIPTHSSSLPLLARALSLLEAEDEAYFHGGYFWFKLWGIWSSQSERIGWSIVERMRLGHGELRPVDLAPVHHFRDDEPTQLQAFLLQAFIFQWDANLVHSTFDRFVHVSHDDYVLVAARTEDVCDRCRVLLQAWDPKPVSDKVRARFCRSGVTTNL